MVTIRSISLPIVLCGLAAMGPALSAQDTPSRTGRLSVEQGDPLRPGVAKPTTDSPQGMLLHAGKPNDARRPAALLPDEFAASNVVSRVMAVMALLVSICLAAMWYGHRNSGMNRKPGSGANGLQVVDTLSLAPRCCVHLIQVDRQRFLLARDNSGIKTITPVSSFSTTLEDLDDGSTEPQQEVSTADLLQDERKHRNYPWTDWNPNG